MKKTNVFILTILFILPLNNVMAFEWFDGQRQGFTLGLGIGYGVVKVDSPAPKENIESPMISGTLSYAFNDSFQIGLGKKVLMGFKYKNKSVYQELGGVVLDFFMDDYYITVGSGIGGAANKFSLDDYLYGDASFIGLGYNLSEGLNVEFVIGNTKFETTNSIIVTPEKETFFGILLTTHIY